MNEEYDKAKHKRKMESLLGSMEETMSIIQRLTSQLLHSSAVNPVADIHLHHYLNYHHALCEQLTVLQRQEMAETMF